MTKEIPPTTASYTDYLKLSNLNSVYMVPTDTGEIQGILAGLKNTKVCGSLNLSVDIIKCNAAFIFQPLTYYD